MKLLKNMELEWKILFMAMILFGAFIWPVQDFLITRLENLLVLSVDPGLENSLRKGISTGDHKDSVEVISSIKRHKQWKALIPVIVAEQRRAVIIFSIFTFFILLIFAIWILKKLTQPLKNLAAAVSVIGEGGYTKVMKRSGGALGKLEQAVDTLQEELVLLRDKFRLQGMETAWRDIAKVMAHEIKNPLTPIRLTLDRIEEKTLLEENISPEDLKKFLQRINNQVDTLERLVNQFRSFSKDPEVSPALLPARDVVEDISEDLSGKINTIVKGDGTIFADPNLMNQILLNLWKNSLEANANQINVYISSTEKDTLIIITDNGDGIESSDLEKIWLPYVTHKKGGTGLGLPVVRKIVESMNGTISIYSEGKGEGVKINLLLPDKDISASEDNNG